MDYDKIILDLLNRIVILEEKVKKLEYPDGSQKNTAELISGSKKYRFLSDYLQDSNQSRVKLSYAEIEEILGFELPESAAVHRTFWANTSSHSIALSWLSVNYSVAEVNLEDQYIVFEQARDVETVKKVRSTTTTEENHLRACRNYAMIELYKKLKETVFARIYEIEEVGTGATSYYVSWNVSGRRQFANFYIQKKKIRILTLTPISVHSIGETVPDTHAWTLNYQVDISSEADIAQVTGILLESYHQVKHAI